MISTWCSDKNDLKSYLNCIGFQSVSLPYITLHLKRNDSSISMVRQPGKSPGKMPFCFAQVGTGDNRRETREEWRDGGNNGDQGDERDVGDQGECKYVKTVLTSGCQWLPWNVSWWQPYPLYEVPRLALASCFRDVKLQMVTNGSSDLGLQCQPLTRGTSCLWCFSIMVSWLMRG